MVLGIGAVAILLTTLFRVEFAESNSDLRPELRLAHEVG
jgi:hypothetical protein